MRFLFFGLLVVTLLGWLFTYQRQRWRIRALERTNEAIQVEENLVFDFLHGLGEAFRDVIRPHDLHRLIVESSVRILDALVKSAAKVNPDLLKGWRIASRVTRVATSTPVAGAPVPEVTASAA
jgi:transposase-like protein